MFTPINITQAWNAYKLGTSLGLNNIFSPANAMWFLLAGLLIVLLMRPLNLLLIIFATFLILAGVLGFLGINIGNAMSWMI